MMVYLAVVFTIPYENHLIHHCEPQVCALQNCTEMLANTTFEWTAKAGRSQCGGCDEDSAGCDGRDSGFPEAGWILPTNVAATAIFSLVFPFCGMLADKYGMFFILKIATLGSLVCALPAFMIMSQGTAAAYFFGLMLLAWGLALLGACLPTLLITAFDPEVRYTAVAVGYNTGQAIFGGLSPLLATAMVKGGGGSFGGDISPGSWYMLLVLFTAISVWVLGKRRSYAAFDDEDQQGAGRGAGSSAARAGGRAGIGGGGGGGKGGTGGTGGDDPVVTEGIAMVEMASGSGQQTMV